MTKKLINSSVALLTLIMFILFTPLISAGGGAGGTITIDGSYTVHTFLINATFNVTGATDASILIVAGGGGGASGGGGAGGVYYNASYSFSAGVNYNISIGMGGAGGSGGDASVSGNGTNSTINGNDGSRLSALGGGGGGKGGTGVADKGHAGGSGGGAGAEGGITKYGGLGLLGQGYFGGSNAGQGDPFPSGGGGGAGEPGHNATSKTGGNGGDGLNFTINGTNVYYAGGGGGSYFYTTSGTYGQGGIGGGGNGGISGGNGLANTGGGGGGAKASGTGGAGGSGIIIIRYLTSGATVPTVNITYPINITYNNNVSTLNYITSNAQNCWYSNSSGFWNSTTVIAGINFTNVRSITGNNKWTVYCNDSAGVLNSSSVTFFLTPLNFVIGSTVSNKSFRITEFIKTSGTNFTLGGKQYRLMGADSYYLTDYGTNHTYDDNGNEINGSRQAVLEILNEAKLLNINVIRTWASGSGSAGSSWIINKSGGHHNLFEVGVPGNYSEEMFASLDWLISEASKRDIRLQLVLINNWNEYGGMRWYVQQSPTTDKTYQWINDSSNGNWDKFHDQFYNDTNTLTYYKNFINYTLLRNNTVTGRLYKDEPAIFAWLLANEPRAKAADPLGTNKLIRNFTINLTAYIKSIDTNHLVGLGIEGFGDPFDGTDMISVHNGTGVDFATFELHPSQWDWLAQRSEGVANGAWITGGITSNDTLDWWSVGKGYSFNNRYEGSFIPNYKPTLPRHGYNNWVSQNVNWSNQLNLPVLLSELAMPTSSSYSQKTRFFDNSISSFYKEGGDGLMMWNLNHDNYYYSTTPAGIMDDGYSFYYSDDVFLKNKSQSVIDAFNFTMHNNTDGTSWVDLLNSYKYDFTFNVTSVFTSLRNCTLNLNTYNGTWSGNITDQINSTTVTPGLEYTFTKQFAATDSEFQWFIRCCDDTCIDSNYYDVSLLTNNYNVTLISPANNTFYSSGNIAFEYNITSSLDIAYCNFYLDGVLDKTSSSVILDTTQNFTETFVVPAMHTWYIQCKDIGDNIATSPTRQFGIDNYAPNATLISPINNTYANASSQNFTVNVSDDLGIANATLYIYNTTGLVNKTAVLTPTNPTSSLIGIIVNLVDNVYQWFYKIFDRSNKEYLTENNTLIVDTTFPLINFITPPTPENGVNLSASNFSVLVNVTDINFANNTFRLYNSAGALINETWSNISNAFYYQDCYQETANISTGGDGNCGLNYSGFYSNSGGITNPTNYYDGNWGTAATYNIYASNIQSYYSIPKNAIGAIWQVKDGSGIYNLTIPKSCFDYYLSFNLLWVGNLYGGTTTDWQCFNDSGNQNLLINPGNIIYEESIYWILNGSINLPDGTYYYNVTTTDLAGNQNTTETRKITLDTHNPNATLITPGVPSTGGSGSQSGSYVSNKSQNYTVNLTDNLGIKNATLYIFNRSTGELVNQTTTTFNAGIVNTVLGFFVDLADGIYNWFYSVFDWSGNQDITENYTITIDTTPPKWNFTVPPTPVNGANLSAIGFSVQVNVTEINFANGTFRLYNSAQILIDNATINYTITYSGLPNGIYYYNITFKDLANNLNETETRKITLDTTSPQVIINYPTLYINYINSYFNTSLLTTNLNWTITELHPASCWYSLNLGVTNVTVACSDNSTSINLVSNQNYTIYLYANDTFGNFDSTHVHVVFKALILRNSVSYAPIVLEGSDSLIVGNFTLARAPSSITLAHPGGAYTPSISIVYKNGSNYILTASAYNPLVDASGNYTFFYTFVINGISYDSDEEIFTILDTSLSTNCSAGNYPFVDISNYDEETLQIMNGTVKYTLALLSNTLGEDITYMSGNLTGTNVSFCTNQNLSNTYSRFALQLRYYGDGYLYETYNLPNARFSNTTLNIPLYFLNNTIGTQFKINYEDFEYITHPGAVMYILRQYLDTDTYTIVEAPIVDNNGRAIASFNTNNIKYKIIVVDGTNMFVYLDIFSDVFPVCQNVVLGTCELNLRGAKSTSTSTTGDFTYTLTKTNTSIILTFVIPSGTPRTIQFVTNQSSSFLSSISNCDKTVHSSAGTITCGYNTTVGDSIISTQVINSDGTVLYGSIPISEDMSSFFMLNNYFIAFVLLLSIGLMFISSAVMMVLGAVIGVLYLGLIFLLRGADLFTVASSLGWLVVAAVIIIYYVSKKEER